MMKKMTYVIAVLFFIGAFYTIYTVAKKNIGDIRPAILPAKKIKPTNTRSVAASTTVSDVPLIIPTDYIITTFAQNMGAARDLVLSPGGVVLVSDTNGRVIALPDKDKDGKAEEIVLLSGLDKPHGLAFYKNKLFIAEETKISRYNWDEANLTTVLDKTLFELPSGGRHFTRTIAFNKSGQMFVSLGSTCDTCDEQKEWIAEVIVSDSEGKSPQVFAKGLRNAVFITINPQTDELWGTEMGRDNIGDDIPPDEINIIRNGKDYGWPICYGNKIHDTNFDKRQYIQDPCINTEAPIHEIQAHSAPLGLTFISSKQFPKDWQGDLLVAYHGSWNRSEPTGYKIVHMKVKGNTITSEEDFITGFLQGAQTIGRPVDMLFDTQGNLYISDDKGGSVYYMYKK